MGGSAAKLTQHIKSKHKTVMSSILSKKKRRSEENPQSAPPKKAKLEQSTISRPKLNAAEKKVVDQLLAEWICRDLRPLSAVEDEGLRAVLSFLGYPGNGAPCARTMKSRLEKEEKKINE